MSSTPEETRGRGIYLLPNLFTITALFAGFYAIVAAMKGHFENASIAVFVAMIMDSLDGRIARLTNTQTAFGAQLDSLSDMVSFGLAPALVMYTYSLIYLGKLGWLTAFLYAVAVALRLARFNTKLDVADKRYFQGLASPAGAGIIAGFVWVCYEYEVFGFYIRVLASLLTVLIAFLMVSNIKYRSFKDLDLKGNVSFMAILTVVLIFVLISIAPPQVLFIAFFIYGLSGPLNTLWHLYRKRRLRNKTKMTHSDSKHDKS